MSYPQQQQPLLSDTDKTVYQSISSDQLLVNTSPNDVSNLPGSKRTKKDASPKKKGKQIIRYDDDYYMDLDSSGKSKLPKCTKSLGDVVIPSPFSKIKDPKERWQAIVGYFNEGQESIMTTATRSGKRLKPNEILLVHCNYKVEAVPRHPQGKMWRRKWSVVKKIWDNTSGYIGKFKQNDPKIGEHGKYILNVPPGQYAKALRGSGKKPVIYGPGTHVIKDPNFIFNSRAGFVKQSELYINHNPIHILRVPRGKVAKVTIDSTPYLLTGRDEPYVFESATFKLPSNNLSEVFKDTTDQKIIHGSLKKITPFPGERGIAYYDGELEIIDKPISVDNEKFKFDKFLQVNMQKYVFPSQEAQNIMRREENKNYMFEQFRTNDGLEVGVKLLVLIEIKDAKLLVQRLRGTDVKGFVEDIVVTAMGNVIQHHSSAEFQKPSQSMAPSVSRGKEIDARDLQHTLVTVEATKTFFFSLQEEVTAELKTEFEEVGIDLIRMNIETAKVLDQKIAHEISEFAVTTTKVATQVALLGQQTETKRVEAEQGAMQVEIGAQAKAAAKVAKAGGDLKAAQIELKKMQMEAKFYRENPHMLRLRMLEVGAEAVKNINNANLTPGQFTDLVYSRFFNNQAQNIRGAQNLLEVDASQQGQQEVVNEPQ